MRQSSKGVRILLMRNSLYFGCNYLRVLACMAFISFNTFIHNLLGAGPLLKLATELVLGDFYLDAGVDGATLAILNIAKNSFRLIDACLSFGARC